MATLRLPTALARFRQLVSHSVGSQIEADQCVGKFAMNHEIKIPPKWGEDPLSQFIKDAWHNTYATFSNLKPEFTRLTAIHSRFQKIIGNLVNSPEWFSGFFLMRARSAYLAGARLSLSVQITECYMVLRGCLENGLYGLHISNNPDTREIWLCRHDNETSKRKSKSEFAAGNVFKTLNSKDKETFRIAKSLYESTIDYGAHPNERGLFSMVRKEQDEQKIDFVVDYLTGNSLPLRLGLKMTARVGVCSLFIFKLVFKERFDILGISKDLDKLKQGL